MIIYTNMDGTLFKTLRPCDHNDTKNDAQSIGVGIL